MAFALSTKNQFQDKLLVLQGSSSRVSTSSIIRAPLGCSLGPYSITLMQQNWRLDLMIQDVCAGHVLMQNLILVS